MAKITVEELVEVAFAVEEGDPFDWAAFKQGREEAMKMIASSVIDQFSKDEYTDQDLLIMLASITKLLTENMILQTKVLTQSQKDA